MQKLAALCFYTCAYEKGVKKTKKTLAFASFPGSTNTAKIKAGNNRATHYPPPRQRETAKLCQSIGTCANSGVVLLLITIYFM